LGLELLSRKLSFRLISTVFYIGASILGLWSLVDSLIYKRLIFVPWEFIKVNSIEKISEFYGTHSFHWYFSQGIPVVLMFLIPLIIYGILNSRGEKKRYKALLPHFCLKLCLDTTIESITIKLNGY
jgi:hypothetical protein